MNTNGWFINGLWIPVRPHTEMDCGWCVHGAGECICTVLCEHDTFCPHGVTTDPSPPVPRFTREDPLVDPDEES